MVLKFTHMQRLTPAQVAVAAVRAIGSICKGQPAYQVQNCPPRLSRQLDVRSNGQYS